MPVFQSQGNEVMVFQFAMYNIHSDEVQQSKRWATQNFIERFGATRVGAGVKVDVSLVDANGLTDRGFDPHRGPGGFQTEVSLTQRP